jgi:site-specific DNA recombinase
MTKRAAIYCRVSTPAQAADDKTSLARQERECRRRAEEDGLTVVEEYVVLDAASGSDPDRVKLERLLQAAERGAFEAVIFDLVDRTSRGGAFSFADICNRFLRFGVMPVWATDRAVDLTTPDGQLLALFYAWRAQMERDSISRRFQRGKQERLRQGKLARAHLPYGYKWSDDHEHFEPDPVSAPIVQRIYEEVASGRASTTSLAKTLNQEGVPTPIAYKGQKRQHPVYRKLPPRWVSRSITVLLRNPVYKGERYQNQYTYVERDPRERKERRLNSVKERQQRDPSEWLVVEVPALVSAELWERAIAQLAINQRTATKNPKRFIVEQVLLYGGSVRCAHCGYAMEVSGIYKDGEPLPSRWIYRCVKHGRTQSGERCIGASISAKQLDEFVWSEAVRLVREPERLRSLMAETQEVWSPQTQVAHYTEQIAKVDVDDEQVTAELLRLSGRPGLEQIRANLELQAERNAELRGGYQQQLTLAQDALDRRATSQQRLQTFEERANELSGEELSNLTATQKREILLSAFHPDVFVARRGRPEPRVGMVFWLSPEAVAQANPRDMHTTLNWVERTGESYYVSRLEQDTSPRPQGDSPTIFDFGDSSNTEKYSENLLINVASAEDLHNALGISLSIARRIVAYRAAHGSFTAISQLLLVPISRAEYDKIAPLVTI